MIVDVEELAELRVFAIRHLGPYEGMHKAFVELHAIAQRHGLTERPGTQLLAIYHDDPQSTPAAALRSDAGVTVPPDLRPIAGLEETRIPEGIYAMTIHRGPYAGLPAVWGQLKGWLPTSGYRAGAGPSFEIYKNTPGTAKPEDVETELYVALAR